MTQAHETLRCTGMHDLSPEEMERFRHVEHMFRTTCENWGFREVRTPVIEHLHLFTSAGTLSPQMLGRVYSFLDWDGWSGERVVLRPDATIPAARLYWERYRGQIAKFFYVENIFRFAPSEERREIWQCGAELIGESWPLGDLEVIDLVRGILQQLGFARPTLRLSHTGIIRAILSTAGYTPEQQLALYDRLIEGDLGVFPEIESRLPQAAAPLTMLRDLTGGQVDGLRNLQSAFGATLPRIMQPVEELRTIASTLSAAGCSYVLDLTIVRGFEYYTGPVFQVLIDGQNVAGGGRYDGLVASQEGQAVPACGFAISVDPLLALLDQTPTIAIPEIVHVIATDRSPEGLAEALSVATQLHAAGYHAQLVSDGRGEGRRRQLRLNRQERKPRYSLSGGSPTVTVEAESIERIQQALAEGAGA